MTDKLVSGYMLNVTPSVRFRSTQAARFLGARQKNNQKNASHHCYTSDLTYSSFLFKAPIDLLSLLLQLVAQLLLCPLLLFLQEAQLSQLLPPEETTEKVQSGCHHYFNSFHSQKNILFFLFEMRLYGLFHIKIVI